MVGYLFRRFLQMILVVLLAAAASFTLLLLAPGGPTAYLRQLQQNPRTAPSAADMARLRASYDLDLYIPFQFTRWLIGEPRGSIVIGGTELFADVPIGCGQEVYDYVENASGKFDTVVSGCTRWVYLKDLEGRRHSRGVLLGDFGVSWKINRDRPVSTLIASRVGRTVQLAGLSLFFALLLGIPIGIYSAVKQYSKFDYFFTSLAFMGSAMPTFFFGIIMILLFSVLPYRAGGPYLPPGSALSVRDYTIPGLGTVDAGSSVDALLHLILPVATLTLVSVSGWSRFIRASMLEVMRQDYVRTARAKGLSERVVIVKHALRNALIPFVTIIVFSLPGLFGGAIITETIFSWPGMGRLYWQALGEYDYPVAMAILFITAILTVIATLLRDILYTLVDPRIRLS
jgi:peptide/nickel transport system permease protein